MRHYLNEGAHMNGYYEKAYDLYSQFTGNYSLFTSGENPYIDQFKKANNWNSETIMALSVDPSSTGGNTGVVSIVLWYIHYPKIVQLETVKVM